MRSHSIVVVIGCLIVLQSVSAFLSNNDSLSQIIKDTLTRKEHILQEAINRVGDQVAFFAESVEGICRNDLGHSEADIMKLRLSELSHNYGHELKQIVIDTFKSVDFVVSIAERLIERKARSPRAMAILGRILREKHAIHWQWEAFVDRLIANHLATVRKSIEDHSGACDRNALAQLLRETVKLRFIKYEEAARAINADAKHRTELLRKLGEQLIASWKQEEC